MHAIYAHKRIRHEHVFHAPSDRPLVAQQCTRIFRVYPCIERRPINPRFNQTKLRVLLRSWSGAKSIIEVTETSANGLIASSTNDQRLQSWFFFLFFYDKPTDDRNSSSLSRVFYRSSKPMKYHWTDEFNAVSSNMSNRLRSIDRSSPVYPPVYSLTRHGQEK